MKPWIAALLPASDRRHVALGSRGGDRKLRDD